MMITDEERGKFGNGSSLDGNQAYLEQQQRLQYAIEQIFYY